MNRTTLFFTFYYRR